MTKVKTLFKNKVFLCAMVLSLCFLFYFCGWMTQKNKLESTLYTVETITGIVVEGISTDSSDFDPAAEYHLVLYTDYSFGLPAEKPTKLVRLVYPTDIPGTTFVNTPVSVGDRITAMVLYHPSDMPAGYIPYTGNTDVIYPIVTFVNHGPYHSLPDWLQK